MFTPYFVSFETFRGRIKSRPTYDMHSSVVLGEILSLGISWLGLNDAGDTRKFKSLISFNFGSGETGHSQLTWPIFILILPLTLVLHVYEISGNRNESWIGIGQRERPYFLYIDL